MAAGPVVRKVTSLGSAQNGLEGGLRGGNPSLSQNQTKGVEPKLGPPQ